MTYFYLSGSWDLVDEGTQYCEVSIVLFNLSIDFYMVSTLIEIITYKKYLHLLMPIIVYHFIITLLSVNNSRNINKSIKQLNINLI